MDFGPIRGRGVFRYKSEIRISKSETEDWNVGIMTEKWNTGIMKDWNIGMIGMLGGSCACIIPSIVSIIPLFSIHFATALRLCARYINDSSEVVSFCYANSVG